MPLCPTLRVPDCPVPRLSGCSVPRLSGRSVCPRPFSPLSCPPLLLSPWLRLRLMFVSTHQLSSAGREDIQTDSASSGYQTPLDLGCTPKRQLPASDVTGGPGIDTRHWTAMYRHRTLDSLRKIESRPLSGEVGIVTCICICFRPPAGIMYNRASAK